MKKYLSVLFPVFVFSILIIPGFSFAQVTDVDPDSSTSDCVALQNNLRYKDRDSNKNGEVSTLQDFLQSKNYLNSEPTGYLGLMTVKAVKDFQKDNSISPTGYVGPATRAKIKALTCGGIVDPITPITNGSVNISGISGPQTLSINEQGTWTVNASDSSGKTLMYSVAWGDENYSSSRGAFYSGVSTSTSIPQQSATFTHTYPKSGTFSPRFTVTNSDGKTANTSVSVKVGITTTTSSITILSPNSGTVVTDNDLVTVTWRSAQTQSYFDRYEIFLVSSLENNSSINASADGSVIPKSSTSTRLTLGRAVKEFIINHPNLSENSIRKSFSLKVVAWNSTTGSVVVSSNLVPITINPITANTPFVTVISPNGGETVDLLNPFYFMFNTNNVYPAKHYINLVDETLGKRYSLDSLINPNGVTFTQDQIQLKQVQLVVPSIAKSYNLNTSDKYKIEICVNNICDKSDNYFTITSSTTVGPVISNVSGSTSLNVNQQGTWTVNASDPSGKTLTYTVAWGDTLSTCASRTYCAVSSPAIVTQQTATFTHTYKVAGTYTPTFTVINSSGQSAKTTKTVVVGNVTTPSITVLSPKGGEIIKTGNKLNIQWSSQNLPLGSTIHIQIFNSTYAGPNKTIVSGLPSSATSYAWTVAPYSPNIEDGWGFGANQSLFKKLAKLFFKTANAYQEYGNQYYISISVDEGNVFSNSGVFTISPFISSTPTISGITGPQTLNVNQQGTWVVKASDSNNEALTYSVSWGEITAPCVSGTFCAISAQIPQQTATFTHIYKTAGTYTPKFTVTNSSGQSAQTSLSIVVSELAVLPVTCTSTTNIVEAALGNPGGTGPFEKLGLDISSHPEILKYRIQWFNGIWSDWYVPGVGDQDWNNNLDGTARRIWSYFDDHTHEYITCSTTINTTPINTTPINTVPTRSTYSGIISSTLGASQTANALDAFNNTTNNQQNTQVVNNSTACPEITLILSKGMNNPEVKCLQKMLIEKGFKIDGIKAGEETTWFDYATMIAVKKFQASKQLKVDGIFGPDSLKAIRQ